MSERPTGNNQDNTKVLKIPVYDLEHRRTKTCYSVYGFILKHSDNQQHMHYGIVSENNYRPNTKIVDKLKSHVEKFHPGNYPKHQQEQGI